MARQVVALGSAGLLGTVLTVTAAGPALAGQTTGSNAAVSAPAGPPLPLGVARSARVGAAASAVVRRQMPNPLLKEVLAGEREDEENPDDASLSALCQDFLGKPTPYRDPGPNVDMIVGDATVATGSQTGCSSAQNETAIAVNPFNPRNIVAGANDYRIVNTRVGGNDSSGFAYTSRDGGRTWTNTQLPGLTLMSGATGRLSAMDASGDPAIAFGPHNTVYYVSLVFSRVNPASGITVSVSHDGGLHWDAPAIVHTDGVADDGTPMDTPIFNDKPWITADPFSGTVHVTWTRFEFDEDGDYVQSPIVISTSHDFGRTWSEEKPVGPTLDTFHSGITPFAQGSNPRIAPDGTLYVAYETSVCKTAACDQPTDHDATVIASSRDGGRSFRVNEIAPNFDFPTDPDSGGGLTDENFRVNSFPLLDVDRLTGRLWVTWADNRNGTYDAAGRSVRTNGDVIVASSKDGSHWKVDTVGTGADEIYPAVAAFANRVAVSTYTRAFDRNGIGLDYVYFSGSGNSLGSWLNRITTQSQNPQVQFVSEDPDTGEVFQGVFIGDYTGIAMGTDMSIHPCWTDFRGNPGTTGPNQDAYTQSISLLR